MTPTNTTPQPHFVPGQPRYPVDDSLRPLVDGFTLSLNQLYLPTSYRASALTDMETLRRARSYRPRWYVTPADQQTIPAYSQLEYQITSVPGSYVWGLIFYTPFTSGGGTPNIFDYARLTIQITDECTEIPFFSDYATAWDFRASFAGVFATKPYRNPFLINPRLFGNPAKLNVEIYNGYSTSRSCQLVVFVAEPSMSPEETQTLLRKQGLDAEGYGDGGYSRMQQGEVL